MIKRLFLVSGMILLPIFVLFLWSFSTKWIYPALFPEAIGLNHVKQMIAEPNFWPSILNSSWIAFLTTGLSLLLALPAARFLAFQKVVSKRWLEFIIYLPLILPAIAIITSTQLLFIQLRLTGTFTGIVLLHTYFALPYAMQILLNSYQQLGEEYQLTAQTLGAKSWQIFWQISFPLLRPGIMTAASLVFVVSFSQYLPTFFIGGGKIITLPLILLPYANNGRFGLASAYSLVFLLLTMIGVFGLKKILGGRHGAEYPAA